MNHSSDKCQPALVHALIPVNPFIRRARPVPGPRRDARGLRQPPVCRHAPKTIFTQSLVNSRLSLVHLSVTLTFQRIGQRGDSYRLPAARIRLPFARCPCTKPAICAGAVNHPHHINHMNHSSDKCQPALVHALIPVNPSIRRARPVPGPRRATRGLRQPPVCRHAPKTFSPNLS